MEAPYSDLLLHLILLYCFPIRDTFGKLLNGKGDQ